MDEYIRLARVMKQANQRELDARLAVADANEMASLGARLAEEATAEFMEAHKRWLESL